MTGISWLSLHCVRLFYISALILCLIDRVSVIEGFSLVKPVTHTHYKTFLSAVTPQSVGSSPSSIKSLTKDGEVSKELLRKSALPSAAAKFIEAGDILAIEYVGRVVGQDQPFAQGSKTKFVHKDGTMIKGWDVAVGSMKIGERARFLIGSNYGYGDKGIPGVIPPNSDLEFEITVLGWLGNQMKPETLFKSDLELDPFLATTPEQIQAEYNQKLQEKRDDDRYKGNIFQIYFRRIKNMSVGFAGSGFFRSTTGEAAPWYLNPLITFPSMAAIVIAAFVAVFYLGGVREKGFVASDLDAPTPALIQQQSSERGEASLSVSD